ncbi:MAG: MBL fold metallo-hydrolase [Planctomycetota bacterium]|nr:MBL fold metallo-hydrolase [Planctomycetota bacterium]
MTSSSSALCTLQLCVGELQENCYLLWRAGAIHLRGGAKLCAVFDPGAEAERIRREMKEHQVMPAAFVQTHCHGDHIGALTELKAAHPGVPLYVPEAELHWLKKPLLNLSYFVGGNVTAPDADHPVRDGDVLDLGFATLRAIHVPGHSPGGTAYYVEDASGEPPHLFCGDILFQNGIGRTDLPGGGGMDELVAGIREKLFVLPDNTVCHPGHGPETTIGDEKAFNPFCGLDEGGIA